jgi:hypothetical protein
LERTWERSDVEEIFLCLYIHICIFVYGFGYGFRRAQLSFGGGGGGWFYRSKALFGIDYFIEILEEKNTTMCLSLRLCNSYVHLNNSFNFFSLGFDSYKNLT